MEEKVVLQPDEIEILSSMYIDKERIKKGELFSYHKENLERYRCAKNYLAEKYPGYELRIVGGEPRSQQNPYAEFSFINGADDEKHYSVYVRDGEDGGEYYAEDDFYSFFFTKQYEAYIQEILGKEIPNIVAVSVSMSQAMGEEYGLDMKIDDIAEGRIRIEANTRIFLADSGATEADAEAVAGNIEEIVKEYGLYGFFQVYVYDDGYSAEDMGDIGAMENLPKNYRFKNTFQNF